MTHPLTTFRTIFFIIGIFLTILGIAMLIPFIMDYLMDNEDWHVFGLSALLTSFVGGLLVLSFRSDGYLEIGVREAFLLTALSWLSVIFFASLPIQWSHGGPSLTDAIFETTSALTTTGATSLPSKSCMNESLLLWVSLLQWLGGIGIIVMALTILPFLKIGGMQLFRTESSDRSEKIMPRISQMTQAIFLTYVFFTLIGIVSLWAAGMDFLDAVCHGFTAIATGGLSTKDLSIAYYDSPLIEGVLMLLMIAGGGTMILFARAFRSSPKILWADDQFRLYLKLLFFFSMICTFWHAVTTPMDFLTCLRHSCFNVVAVVTTTGFTSTDYSQWGSFATAFFFFLTFLGGCTGSTSGGIKVFRFQILSTMTKMQLRQIRHPHGIFIPKYNGNAIEETIYASVITFLVLFGASFALLSLALSLFDLDIVTCLSGAAAILTNGGSCIGPVLGPSGSFAGLPEGAKWILILGMILGRLEFVTIFLIFSRSFWRS